MAGCSYCGQMHAPLYICDEMRKAKAVHAPSPKVAPSPNIVSPKASPKTVRAVSPKNNKSGYERNKRWREKHPEAYRAGQRALMAKRYSSEKRRPI